MIWAAGGVMWLILVVVILVYFKGAVGDEHDMDTQGD